MPASADSEVVRLSMLTLRHVKTVVIWLSSPTLFSDHTVLLYSCTKHQKEYSSRIAETGEPAGTIGNTFASLSTRTSNR